jgi:hypothetical protein
MTLMLKKYIITSIITVRAIKLIEKCERVLSLIARHSIQFIFSKMS